MIRFAALCRRLEETQKAKERTSALLEYFKLVPEKDILWAIAILSSKRPKRTVRGQFLKKIALNITGVPDWLFDQSYDMVGDLVETISIILPVPNTTNTTSLSERLTQIKNLASADEAVKVQEIAKIWTELQKDDRLIFNKLLTGSFRLRVSQKNMAVALANFLGKEASEISARLMSDWEPDSSTYQDLLVSEINSDISRPYQFCLGSYLEDQLSQFQDIADYAIEWKWDGIRAQIIFRKGQVFVWSRANELVTAKFPELENLLENVPDGTVLDGEILAFKDGKPLPIHSLISRYNRKSIQKKLLEEIPVLFMAYDLLEFQTQDIRKHSYSKRRLTLQKIVEESESASLLFSDTIDIENWDQLKEMQEECRSIGAEGFMVKKLNSHYHVGREGGEWWKLKNDPMTMDAIMLYATRGQGPRSKGYSEYTLAVWNKDALVPITKAKADFTDAEISEIREFVKANTIERFGPVTSVKAELVFEISFEGIDESKRHKSGLVLRNPQVIRWRKDKTAKEADTLRNLKNLL